MTLKAIETIYSGYRFRSRLEARWAVFFDTLGVDFVYEHQGFDLGEAGWYLPDFYLLEQDAYIEIKGREPDAKDVMKARALCEQSIKDVFIFYGDIPYPYPDRDSSSVLAFRYVDTLDRVVRKSHALWTLCPLCGCPAIAGDEFAACCMREVLAFAYSKARYHGLSTPFSTKIPSILNTEFELWFCEAGRLKDAYAAARQARFEHGESP